MSKSGEKKNNFDEKFSVFFLPKSDETGQMRTALIQQKIAGQLSISLSLLRHPYSLGK